MKNVKALANRVIEERKTLRRERLDQRKNEIFGRFPRVAEIERRFDETGIKLISSVADGSSAEDAVLKIMQENRLANQEKTEILTSAGYPADYLEDKPLCDRCGDTGYIEGRLCGCIKAEIDRELLIEANLSEKLSSQTFDGFRLDLYSDVPDPMLGVSPRENMRTNFSISRKFAENFAATDKNLFFTGGCGLGKTYLSSAIANELIGRGTDVLYVSANSLFPILEDIHFNRDVSERNQYLARHVFDAELLILDDLGAEFVTPFTSSELFRIINDRLLDGKKIIISTNLSINETEKRYSPRVYSRLIGSFEIIKFFGEDIRWKLKNGEM